MPINVRALLTVCGLMFVISCQVAPTRVRTSQSREFSIVVDKTQRPVEINEQTVVLDVRSPFDYGLNRIENSFHFPWTNLSEKPETGELLRDIRQASLKLSLAGLDPKTPVVIVGYGLSGDGGEGRLAWNLLYMGFHDVQTATVETFRKRWTQAPSPAPQNAPQWTPNPRLNMVVGSEEFRALAQNPKLRLEKRIWLIDTRTAAEYFNKDSSSVGPAPDINAIQIEWKEFFTGNGRPNPTIAKKLTALGIKTGDRVILISNRGVRSAAAAYSLTALGFSNVQNFIGGWRSLLK